MNDNLEFNMKISSSSNIDMKVKGNEPIDISVEEQYIETDPIFRNSPAYKITNQDIINWDNKSDFSGNYNDLTNKPLIPTKTSNLINNSGFITKTVNDLTNYTLSNALSTVATTGNYNDLNNKPTIPTKTSDLINDTEFITNATNTLQNYTLSSDLATVATTGNYNDLSNKPSVPTKTSDLINDSDFITDRVDDLQNYTLSALLSAVATSGDYSDLIGTPTIPTNTSDLNNDSGFITNTVNDLTNYTLSSALSTVATTGDYNDLLNKPSALTLDSTVSTTSTNGVENQAITNYVNSVVDSGSNANGNYVKYLDGTMICYGMYSSTLSITSQFEGVYYANTGTITFPVEFYDKPVVFTQVNIAGGGFTYYGYNKTNFSGFIWKIQSKSNASVEMNWTAIGRWKQ